MKIAAVRVRGFRCLRDVQVGLDPLTILIGPNGTGKSALLRALAFFFDEKPPLDERDLNVQEAARTIEVEVELDDVPGELQAFCNENGCLTVSRVWDAGGQARYVLQRRMLPGAADVFSAPSAQEARERYQEVRSRYPQLPAWTSRTQAEQELDTLAAQHPGASFQRQEADRPQFGQRNLKDFVEFVLVPAMEDPVSAAQEARGSPLSVLTERLVPRDVRSRVENRLKEIARHADSELEAAAREFADSLTLVSEQLNDRLQAVYGRGSVCVRWAPDAVAPRLHVEVDLQEHGATVPVGRQGHGLQRAYLLAVLMALAKKADDEQGARTVILAIEEPELYQHPPQARALAATLKGMTSERFQIIYTTHSPLFVPFEVLADSVRCVRIDGATGTKVTRLDRAALQDLATRASLNLDRHLQLLAETPVAEGLFSRAVVLVEGDEDRAYVEAACRAGGLDLSAQGVSLIPVGGKGRLVVPAAVLQNLGVSVFVVFDTDQDRTENKERHAELNRLLLRMCNATSDIDFPATETAQSAAWFAPNIKEAVRRSAGERLFDDAMRRARDEWEAGEKSPLVLARVLEFLQEQGGGCPALESLVDELWQFLKGVAVT